MTHLKLDHITLILALCTIAYFMVPWFLDAIIAQEAMNRSMLP